MTKQDLIDLFHLKSHEEHISLEAAADMLASYLRANLSAIGDRELAGLLEMGAILVHLAEEDGWLYNRKIVKATGQAAPDTFSGGSDNFNRFMHHDRGLPREPLSSSELRALKRMGAIPRLDPTDHAHRSHRSHPSVNASHNAATSSAEEASATGHTDDNKLMGAESTAKVARRETITEDELSIMIQEFQDRHPGCSGLRYERPFARPLDREGVNWDLPTLHILSSAVAPACHYVMEEFLHSLQLRFNLDQM